MRNEDIPQDLRDVADSAAERIEELERDLAEAEEKLEDMARDLRDAEKERDALIAEAEQLGGDDSK